MRPRCDLFCVSFFPFYFGDCCFFFFCELYKSRWCANKIFIYKRKCIWLIIRMRSLFHSLTPSIALLLLFSVTRYAYKHMNWNIDICDCILGLCVCQKSLWPVKMHIQRIRFLKERETCAIDEQICAIFFFKCVRIQCKCMWACVMRVCVSVAATTMMIMTLMMSSKQEYVYCWCFVYIHEKLKLTRAQMPQLILFIRNFQYHRKKETFTINTSRTHTHTLQKKLCITQNLRLKSKLLYTHFGFSSSIERTLDLPPNWLHNQVFHSLFVQHQKWAEYRPKVHSKWYNFS